MFMTRVGIVLVVAATMLGVALGEPARAAVYDDFAGPSIDRRLWEVTDPGGVVYQSGGFLRFSSPPNGVYETLSSRAVLRGDCEVVLDWSQFATTATVYTVNAPNLTLSIQPAGGWTNTFLYIHRNYTTYYGHTYYSNASINGVPVGGTRAAATASSGQLKITRVGTTVSTYYNEGAGWVLLKAYPNIAWGDLVMTFHGYTGDNGTFHAAVDRLSYQGQLVTPLGIKGDFNADAQVDLTWQHQGTGAVYTWFLNGATVTGGAYLTPGMDTAWKVVGTADLNKDGETDLVWQHQTSGAVYVWFLTGTTVTGGRYLTTGIDPVWKVVGVADFNADGKGDLLWYNTATGDVYAWLLDGTTVTGGAYLQRGVDRAWQPVTVGTSDFESFVVWQHQTSGAVYAWLLNGTTVTGGISLTPGIDPAWKVAGVGDVNADGDTDLLWYNTTSGDVYVWYLQNGSVASGAYLAHGVDLNWKLVGPK